MTAYEWSQIVHFKPTLTGDKFGDPVRMDFELMQTLDAFRTYEDKPVIVHCGYEDRKTGWHPKGKAIDLHVVGVSVMNQFLAAQRFPGFTGIGIYSWWNSPGLHLDNRPRTKNQPRSFWGSPSPGKYVPVTREFLYRTL